MSVESFVNAMPKVDVHIQLEGAVNRDLIRLIAEQTDVASNYKRRREYESWLSLLTEPDYARIDEIARETAAWIRHPDDIARMVYDLGVVLSKQNVRYAEVSVIPTLYTDLGMPYTELLTALNDGRDRVIRAWDVRMDWVMAIPREFPRKSDEIARWATNATSQKGNVVGLTLVGREEQQPIAQFKKAFATAQKKVLPTATHLHTSSHEGHEYIDVLEVVQPQRVTDCWEILKDGNFLSMMVEQDLPIVVTPKREVCLNRIESESDFPTRDLLDNQINLVFGSGMPALYETSINAMYLNAVQMGGISIAELKRIALNAVRASMLAPDEKTAMVAEFEQSYAELHDEHLVEETE